MAQYENGLYPAVDERELIIMIMTRKVNNNLNCNIRLKDLFNINKHVNLYVPLHVTGPIAVIFLVNTNSPYYRDVIKIT